MTRALLCSVVLLSLSCSSASSNDNGNNAGASNTSGSGNQSGGSSGSVGTAGSANNGGTGTNAAGAAGTGTNTAGAAGTGTSTAGAAGTGTGSAGAAGSSSNGGTGGAGGTGVGGTGGSGGTGGTGPGTPGVSVTQWGNDIARTAHSVHPSLTKANMTKLAPDTFTVPAGTTEYAGKFAGEVAAIPLYLGGATAGAGEYIAVTTQNDVYAFREGTGALVWKHNVGGFLGQGGSMCGSPANHGIVSTPVIDAAARVIYLAAGRADAHYEIHALNADTGMEIAGGWPVDVSKIKAGALVFPSAVQIQRSALSLVGGTVYVAFGGFCGDAGNYHGWVIGVDSKDPTKTGAWATMDAKAGIWAPGGMASDGNGVFAVTGNVQTNIQDHAQSDSEEIIRVTGLGVGNRDNKNMFFPPEWVNPMNSGDLDFGSSSPAVIGVPGSTPSSVLVAPSKNGRVYFLDASNLGGSSGQFADLAVANTAGASVYTAPSAYTSASGVHAAIATGGGSQCPGGNNNGSVMSILLQPGSPPMPKIAWCAAISGDSRRSPISTNSAGSADPIVWYMNGTKLNGFDGETGAVVFNGGTGTCAGVHSFTQPIAANGHIVTAGDSAGQAHLCAWSVH